MTRSRTPVPGPRPDAPSPLPRGYTATARRLCTAVLLCAAPLLAQDPDPKPEAHEKTVLEEVLEGESHVLFFERMLLMSADGGLRPTDFEIGPVRTRGGPAAPWDTVGIRFLGEGEAAGRFPWATVEAIVRNVETTGGSPWRVVHLEAGAKTEDPVGEPLFEIRALVFARGLVQGPAATDALASFRSVIATANTGEPPARVRMSRVRFLHVERGVEPFALHVHVDVVGERFRSAYSRLLRLFGASMDADDARFTAFSALSGESILPDRSGASYEIGLWLSEPEQAR